MCYAAPVWSMCAETHKKRLQVMQNKVLKMILNLKTRTPTLRVHEDAGIDLLPTYLRKLTANFLNGCLNNTNSDIVGLLSM